jgi:hypothetical protein
MKSRICEMGMAARVGPTKSARLGRELRWLWAIIHGRGDRDLAKKE